MSAVTTVLIVDDEELVRMGLRAVIDAQPDLHVVGEAAGSAEAVRIAGSVEPFVVVAHDRTDAAEEAKLAAQPIADDRVLLHPVEFRGRQP